MRLPGLRLRGMRVEDGQGPQRFLPSCTPDPCTESGRIRVRFTIVGAWFRKALVSRLGNCLKKCPGFFQGRASCGAQNTPQPLLVQ